MFTASYDLPFQAPVWSGHGVPPASRDNRELARQYRNHRSDRVSLHTATGGQQPEQWRLSASRPCRQRISARQSAFLPALVQHQSRPARPGSGVRHPRSLPVREFGLRHSARPRTGQCGRSLGPAILGWRTSAPSNAPRCVQSPEPDEFRTTQPDPGCRIRRRHQSYLDVRAPTRGAGPRGVVRSL